MKAQKIKIRDYNDYRKKWSDAINAKILSDFPLHIDIELTSNCNLRCEMCWQSKDPNAFPKGMMSEKLFKKVIDEGVNNGLCAIKLQSRGEAMMHPKIFEYSRYAKDKGVMDIHLTTNGTLFMKKNKISELFESGIDKLIFSIDDAHDKSIDEIYKRKKPNIREYFKEICKIKKDRKLEKPFMVVQTFGDNEKNLIEIKQKLKIQYPDANDINVNLLWESLPDKESYKNLKYNYKYLPCSYLWSRILVYWDGTTTTCCRDYSGENLTLGDVNSDNIKNLWNSNKMNTYRKIHLKNEREKLKICANCSISTLKLAK